MIKRILLAMMLVAGMADISMAQENMYLIKGNQVVAKYNVDDVDYVSFSLPEGVTESAFNINIDEVTKNSFTYTIKTLSPNKQYIHSFLEKTLVDITLMSYYGTNMDNTDPEIVNNLLKNQLYNGFFAAGTDSYKVYDGGRIGDETINITAGQTYIILVADLNTMTNDLGDDFTYATVTTQTADRSTGTLGVAYNGLNERGDAMFSFNISSEITKVYTMYSTKTTLESFINKYGFEFTLYAYAGIFSPESLADGYEGGWPVPEEDDYIMYALGIDANGDWTEIQKTEQHIVPPVKETVGPQIKIFSKEKGPGHISVNFEIAPSNVTEAYVRLMGENDYDDSVNEGNLPYDIAKGSDAINITDDIRTKGEYTYTNDEVPERWNSLLIMAKNDEATTLTRINFWPDTETEWSIFDNKTISAPSAKPHKTQQVASFKAMTGFNNTILPETGNKEKASFRKMK